MSENDLLLALVDEENEGNAIVIGKDSEQRLSTIRFLRYLVASCPDSLSFLNDGLRASYIATDKLHDIPWHNDVGRVIEANFQFALMVYMPVGRWGLMLLSDPESTGKSCV
jgi:hypothetical protein